MNTFLDSADLFVESQYFLDFKLVVMSIAIVILIYCIIKYR